MLFVSVEPNGFCEDDGKVQISNENDCKKGAERRGLEYKTVITNDDRPKGCYRYKKGKVYFNNYSVGSRSVDATPICMTPGKFRYRMVNYYIQIINWQKIPKKCYRQFTAIDLIACTIHGGLKGNGLTQGSCKSGSLCMASGYCRGKWYQLFKS